MYLKVQKELILEIGFMTFFEVTACISSVFDTFDPLLHEAVSKAPIKQSYEHSIFTRQLSPEENTNSWLIFVTVTYGH